MGGACIAGESIVAHRIHYQVNICGGDFAHVRECFRSWKAETLVYRRHQRMFEGKQDVRPFSACVFDNGELAHRALERVCNPTDPYALAAEIRDGERDLWLVMAAYDEEA
jgi:hypothetical protein